ncbi:MAG: hypothetical protein AAF791_10805 [Bacteroidota bacterium]
MVLSRAVLLAGLALVLAACSRPMPAPPEPLPVPASVDTVAVVLEPIPPPVVEVDTVVAEPEVPPEILLLGRVFEAMGGREAWREVSAYATEGTYSASTRIGQTTINTRSLVAGLRRIRAEQSTPVGDVLALVNGTEGTLFVDGDRGAYGEVFATGVVTQVLFSLPFVLLNADSLTFSREPESPGGLAVLRYEAPGIDAVYRMHVGADGRPIEIVSTQPGPVGPTTVTHRFFRFEEVDGRLVPGTVQQLADGRVTGTTEITRFTVNPEVPPGTFAGG